MKSIFQCIIFETADSCEYHRFSIKSPGGLIVFEHLKGGGLIREGGLKRIQGKWIKSNLL